MAPPAARTPSASPASGPVLLYDGECGVCAASVQFILARERPERASAAPLRFASLKGEYAQELFRRRPALGTVDSVMWVEETPSSPTVRLKGDAVLAALQHLGGPWSVLAAFGRWVPRPVRDALYDAIASRRLSLQSQRCLLPSVVGPSRFLD